MPTYTLEEAARQLPEIVRRVRETGEPARITDTDGAWVEVQPSRPKRSRQEMLDDLEGLWQRLTPTAAGDAARSVREGRPSE